MDNTIEKQKNNLGESIRQRLKNLSDKEIDPLMKYFGIMLWSDFYIHFDRLAVS